MSILIKGMEMPTDDMKNIMILAGGRVFQFSGYGNPKPLGIAVPVPPHGRLKDYDRIMKEYDEWFSKTESREYENMFYALRMAINGSPTIIPAEKD